MQGDLGNLKVKQTVEMPRGLPGPRANFEVSCDKIKMEAEFDLLGAKAGGFGTALGGHVSIEFEKGKGFTIFAGPAVSAGAGPLEGSFKSGAMLKADANGITNIGGRTELEGKTSALGASAAVKEEMDFGLMDEPSTQPHGPVLRGFRTAP